MLLCEDDNNGSHSNGIEEATGYINKLTTEMGETYVSRDDEKELHIEWWILKERWCAIQAP